MNENILVKMVDVENDNMISSSWTSNWSEAIKFYTFLRDNKDNGQFCTEIHIAKDYDRPDRYNDKDFQIEDISIQFGGRGGLNIISVYVRAY